MMQQILLEITSLIIALGVGVYAYPCMSRFTRTLFFQLVTWLIIYAFSWALTTYQYVMGLKMDNQWVFNIQIPLELLFLVIAACYFFKDKLYTYLAIVAYLLFLLVMFLQLTIFGLSVFINYGMVIAGIIVTIFYTLILYKKFDSDHLSWKYSPEVWAATGLIIYFACNIPYFSLFNYLNIHHPDLSRKFFSFITDVLANIRYLFLVIAFWLSYKYKPVLYSSPT